MLQDAFDSQSIEDSAYAPPANHCHDTSCPSTSVPTFGFVRVRIILVQQPRHHQTDMDKIWMLFDSCSPACTLSSSKASINIKMNATVTGSVTRTKSSLPRADQDMHHGVPRRSADFTPQNKQVIRGYRSWEMKSLAELLRRAWW